MKSLIELTKKMILTILLFPIALAHVWFRRTWCFYDVPDELKSVLAATAGEVKAFVARQATNSTRLCHIQSSPQFSSTLA